ncbi:MAG: mannose-6-phosphate isomerase, class I [Ilumatobacter sp.]|nr:mannose-6-phosphate isomerase, class I [Ilumatobacter sp.]
MRRVVGVVQRYDWGDPSIIPQLLGRQPDGEPWAELWLGTHPAGPATFDDGTPLESVTGPLPYLLKVLAAARPLSLQTHPNATQARDGFDRGRYVDPHPKPELLCALTEFEAFCGIRPVVRTLELLDELGTGELRRAVAADGPAEAIAGLYRGRVGARHVVEACASSERAEARWVVRLDESYPGEPGVAATLLLNHVVLRPGDAMRLDAGTLHAYLHGAGVELMGPSDNTIRAGLTTKPVDVDELLRVLDREPLDQPVLRRAAFYPLPAAGVGLKRLATGERHEAHTHELTIGQDGATWYLAPGDAIVAPHPTYVVTSL